MKSDFGMQFASGSEKPTSRRHFIILYERTKMKLTKTRNSLIAFCLLAFSGVSNADTIEFNSILATWIDISPVAGVSTSGQGTDFASMRWGTPPVDGDPQSGYDFAASATPFAVVVPPSPSADFVLGEFAHLNNPIFAPSLESATLQLDIDLKVNSTPIGVLSFFFDFTHTETPNGANPCANGDPNGTGVNINGCADIVTITFNDLSDTFELGGTLYTLNITGFMTDGGLVQGFETIEAQANYADIMANIAIAQVPEPGTLALFGLGLLGLGFARRKGES